VKVVLVAAVQLVQDQLQMDKQILVAVAEVLLMQQVKKVRVEVELLL
jgi:hypothetical protein